MKKKVYLIQPSFRKMDGKVVKGWSQVNCSLDLPMLSASIPDSWEKDFCFEYYSDIDFNTDASVIFLTGMSNDIRHAYDLAKRLKTKNRKLIFGGHLDTFSVTLMPEVCDTIYYGVPGPSEIETILADVEQGKLKPEYHFGVNINFPFDYSMFEDQKVRYMQIMTSVGCRFSCDYCSYQMYYGGKVWLRDLDFVIDDLKEALKQTNTIAFRDINIYNQRHNLINLCNRIIDEKIDFRWGAQCPIYVGNDKEVLDLMKKAGCGMLFIGLESLRQENLDSVHKPFKVSMYSECISNIKAAGIHVAAYFMFGLDYDTKEVFDEVYDFIQENDISLVMQNIYIPNPGSQLYERMKKEGRVDLPDAEAFLEADPIYGMPNSHIYYTPKNISRDDLHEGFVDLARRLTSYRQILGRSLEPNMEALTILKMNMDQRRDRIILENDPEYIRIKNEKELATT